MKNSVFKTISFIFILTVPTIVWLLIMVISPDTFKKLNFDLSEKRELTKLESIEDIATSGEILTDYAADRAPFRSNLITFYQSLQADIEVPYEDVIKPKLLALMFKGAEGGAVAELDDGPGSSLFAGNSGDQSEPDEPIANDNPEIDDKKHTYEVANTVEPTCYKPGYVEYICSDCGKTYKEDLPAKGHNYFVAGDIEPSYEDFGYTLNVCSDCWYQLRTNIQPRLVDENYFAPNTKGNVILGRYNWLFMGTDLDFFKGSNLLTADELTDYVTTLAELKAACDRNNKELVIFFAPNKSSVYREFMPSYKMDSEQNRAQQITSCVKEFTDIRIVYPLDQLRYADRYWRMYFKYDTHWNEMGAFIGAQSINEILGNPVIDPLSIDVRQKTVPADGDLFGLGGIKPDNYPEDYKYEYIYRDDIVVTAQEGQMDGAIFKTTSTNPNGKKMIVLGDSFRGRMSPVFMKDYTYYTAAHIENIGDVTQDILDSDVIVIESVERFDYTLYSAAKQVKRLLNGE